MPGIRRSVGRWEKAAVNLVADVKTVQELLKQASGLLGEPEIDPKVIDGMIARPSSDSATVAAIEAFQAWAGILPDGVINVNRGTWGRLLDLVEGVAFSAPNPNAGGGPYFPFAALSGANWT